MLPEGAAHVPYRGSVRVCKRLGIDYAESVVDFEFGSRMAVPVIQGVVIAEEHYEQVLEELRKDEAERTRKEDEKRRKAALSMWRRLLMGMRIMNQLREEYGDADGTIEIFGHTQTSMNRSNAQAGTNNGGGDGDDMAGGFLPEGFEEDDEDETMNHASSFFPVAEEGDEANADLIVHEGGSKRSVTGGGLNLPTLSKKEQQPVEEAAEEDRPVLVKAKPKAKPRAAKKKLGRRRQRKDTTDDDDDGDDYDYEDDSDYKN
jgi:xeroderma pigmentosum group C-complementing protein